MPTLDATLTLRLPRATLDALKATSARKDATASAYALKALQKALEADKPPVGSMALGISAESGKALAALVARLPEGTDPIAWLMSQAHQ